METSESTKLCKKCGISYPMTIEFFSKTSGKKSSKTGFYGTCKKCKKEYREKNKHKSNAKQRESYKLNRETKLEKNKQWYENNKIEVNKRRKKYRDANRTRCLEWAKRASQKQRSTPSGRLQKNISRVIYGCLKKQGTTKGGSTFEALPYTPKQLCEHLEKQFDEKMCWDNYGSYWHLDHIYPKSLLPYDSLQHPNFLKCWALENLQPLEAKENIKKGAKIILQNNS